MAWLKTKSMVRNFSGNSSGHSVGLINETHKYIFSFLRGVGVVSWKKNGIELWFTMFWYIDNTMETSTVFKQNTPEVSS